VRSREPGITRALDLTTGEVAFERPADQEFFKIVMGHHRCYRNKATERFLVLGRDGTELIDVDTGKGYGNAWFRGACQYGVMPCNGLIYSPPHSCACHIEWKTNSFIALAPARGDGQPARDNRQPDGDETRETPAPGAPVSDAAWPMYRHDIERSGATSMRLGPVSGSADDAGRVVPLKQAWSTDVGSPATQPVVGHGRVIVATPETHTVHALDAGSGEPRWTFTAGSRVDSSPTLYNGTVLFGSADGVIYCLDARDGARCWRQRVAPADRRLVAYDGIESVWPVSGSVLVLDGDVYAVAGRCAFVDGGLRFCRLDAATGSVLQTRTIPQPALPDVLSSDGESLFMRHLRMDKTGQPTAPNVRHLYSAAGFLDGSWWHRTYWQYGHQMQSNYGGWPVVGSRVPAGRLMAIGKKTIYGFGRLNQYDNVGSHVGLGHTEYRLFATARPPRQAKPMQRRKRRYANDVSSRWSRDVPVLVRGMVLCDEVLFIAGPPDVTVTSPPNVKDPYHVASAKALAEQRAALEGKRGARLLAIAVDDGTTLAEVNLGACSGGIVAGPTWDGLSAAEGKLLLATLDGHVVCLAPH
jgi:outer membrane protein assembly factor BamB